MTTDLQDNAKELKDIVKVLNSGIEFYEKAKEKIDNPQILSILEHTRKSHVNSVSRLQPHVTIADGEAETDTSFTVDARKIYTSALASLSSDTELTYIKHLEEVEDKLLEEIDRVLGLKLPLACHTALSQVRGEAQQTHDRIKNLQNIQELEHE